jgi:plastocyanin
MSLTWRRRKRAPIPRILMRTTLALLLCAAAGPAEPADLRVSVVDGANMPVADAAIYATPRVPVAHGAQPRIAIDQVHREFVPRVSVVQVGTPISFPNSDNIRHSVYSFSAPKVFTLKLYAGTPSNPVIFDQPGVVVLGCNIHDTMVAWVLVVDTPYFARTAADGTATLPGLPAGDYVLRAWNNSMSQEQAGEALHVGNEALTPRRLHVDAQAVETMH